MKATFLGCVSNIDEVTQSPHRFVENNTVIISNFHHEMFVQIKNVF